MKTKAKPNYGTHAEWKSRMALWVTRNGVLHVATRSATMLTGPSAPSVVSRLACGGGSTFCPEATTWYDMKRRGKRFCRACVRTIQDAATPSR